jgi:hypothetical protein
MEPADGGASDDASPAPFKAVKITARPAQAPVTTVRMIRVVILRIIVRLLQTAKPRWNRSGGAMALARLIRPSTVWNVSMDHGDCELTGEGR